MDLATTPGDFGQLRAFAAVAGALSFTRAADRLGVTPQALSQTVRALEERLGVRLLHRSTRSVSLTEAGADLLREAGPALDGLDAALEQARGRRARPSGTVRLHSFRIAPDLFVAPALRALSESCPDVVLDVTLDDRVVDVVAGRYDAALRVGETVERDMVAVRLGPDLRQVAVATPDYLARHGSPAHPRDLVRHRCIGWRWPGHDGLYRWEFGEDGRWFEVAVAGPLVANDREFAVKAALEGVGIAFAIEEAVAHHVMAGRLVPLLEAWSAPFPGFFLCYRPSGRWHPRSAPSSTRSRRHHATGRPDARSSRTRPALGAMESLAGGCPWARRAAELRQPARSELVRSGPRRGGVM